MDDKAESTPRVQVLPCHLSLRGGEGTGNLGEKQDACRDLDVHNVAAVEAGYRVVGTKALCP